MSVSQVATTFNDLAGMPVPPKNADRLPRDMAEEYAGDGTFFLTAEDALTGGSSRLYQIKNRSGITDGIRGKPDPDNRVVERSLDTTAST